MNPAPISDAMARSAIDFLLGKMQATQEQGPDRAVFLTEDGEPEPATRALGQQLHAAGGDAAMRYVMNQLERMTQLTWDQQGNLHELDACWNGIGDWRARIDQLLHPSCV
jgi:hypothetical protein